MGRAQFGNDGGAVEVVVRIPDVEHPEWLATVVDGGELQGEGAVTLWRWHL